MEPTESPDNSARRQHLQTGAGGVRAPSWAERITRLLDDGLRIPGTSIRFGADALLGLLLPELGDLVGALLSLSLFWLALERRVPTSVLGRMLLNVAIDALVGAIPVLGDVFDVAFKANRRNLTLIEAHAAGSQRRRASDYVIVAIAIAVLLASLALPIILLGVVLGWLFGQ